MITHIHIGPTRALSQISPLQHLLSALVRAKELQLTSEQIETLKVWLVRYARLMPPAQRIDLSLRDELNIVSVGQTIDGYAYVFDGESYFPAPPASLENQQ